MNEAELIQYLANVILASSADGKITEAEGTALEYILGEIGGRNQHINQALERIKAGYKIQAPAIRYSDNIRNLEDMVLVFLADRKLPDGEKSIIREFAQALQLTQGQLNRIMTESQERAKYLNRQIKCLQCGREVAAESRFCPHCGADQKQNNRRLD